MPHALCASHLSLAMPLASWCRRATGGQTKVDCTGKKDGEKVDITYQASYIWFG